MTTDVLGKLIWNLEGARRTLQGSTDQNDGFAAVINLYGLRVAAAAGSHLSPVGFGPNATERWRHLKRTSKNIGAEVNRTLDELSQQFNIPALAHHPDFLVFEDVLGNAISALDFVDIRIDGPSDLLELSNALEGYIEFRAPLNRNSPFVTATTLNMLLASSLVLDDREVTSVYDPTCGFGGSLIALHSVLHDKGRAKDVRFYGQDINPEAVSVAAWRFLLRGVTDFELEVGDTLLEPRFLEGKELQRFDVVVSVPPLYPTAARDLDKTDPFHRFRYGEVSGSRADYAFVQHVLASTAPDGRAAVTLALSALSRLGYEEEIRSRIIHADLLETVINLPASAISTASGSSTPSSALLFDLAKPAESRDAVFFIDVPKVAMTTESKDLLAPDVLDNVAQIYAVKSESPDLSSLAFLDSIKARNYSLLPQLYIPQTPPTLTDVDTLEERIGELNKALGETLGEFDAALSSIRSRD
jgi:SAM-dependent methyltransferase